MNFKRSNSSIPYYHRPLYYPPIPYVFSRPSTYNTIENDPDARMEIIKSFYNMLENDWLMNDLNHILGYLQYRDGQIKVSKSESKSTDPENIKRKKIEYIKKNMITLVDMAKILSKINKHSKVRWIDLPHEKSMVKNIVEKYILREINAQ